MHLVHSSDTFSHGTTAKHPAPCTLRILHIEDDPQDAFIFARLINEQSPREFDICHESTLESGIGRLENASFDLIVLDINLPRSSGTRSIESIHHKTTEIPIICISGCTDDNTAFEMIRAGAQDYIKKQEMSPEHIARVVKFSIFRKATEKRLNRLAQYDPLTKLPNRRLFEDRFEHAFASAKRNKTSLALMFLDLDQFKEINDTLGHGVGDELLAFVAERLLACVRDADTVARIGGDEFIVLLEGDFNQHGVVTVAEKILHTIAEPIHISGNLIETSVSIGVALYPDSVSSTSTLISRADKAMYMAKSRGKNGFVIYSHENQCANINRLRPLDDN